MTGWTITVPCWGSEHIQRFIAATLPSHRAALAHVAGPFRYIVHTDQPDRLKRETGGLKVDFLPPPHGGAGNKYVLFGDAHREAINLADTGDCIAMLSADIVVSVETFAACEDRFLSGKRAVVSAASPTLSPSPPPIGASAPDLIAWAFEWIHPIVRHCFWPEGKSGTPWIVYFRTGENVVARGFHLHPVAVLKDRPLPFKNTLDIDLLDNFTHDEIHVVTSRHEFGLTEISPPTRSLAMRSEALNPDGIAKWGVSHATPLHWWLSMHRICIVGDLPDAADAIDCQIWDAVCTNTNAPAIAETVMREWQKCR